VPTRVTVRDLPRLISSHAPLVVEGVQQLYIKREWNMVDHLAHMAIPIIAQTQAYPVPNNLALAAAKAADRIELALTLASGTLRMSAALLVIIPRGALLGSTEPYSSRRSADDEPAPLAQAVGLNLHTSKHEACVRATQGSMGK